MNFCIFTGRLTRDPELTTTNSGKNVVDFSIAVNEGKDRVTYVNCQAWEQTADSIAKYFVKGKPINVVARLKNERWTDQNGETRRAERFVVERFNFLPGDANAKNESETEGSPEPEVAKTTDKKPTTRTRKPREPVAATVAEGDFGPEESEDDIPF